MPYVSPTSPSLVGRLCSLVKTASIILKDVIASSEDIFVHEPMYNTHVADQPSDGYQTEVEYHKKPYKLRSPATPAGAALSDVAALKDQLEKMLSDETTLLEESSTEQLSVRLYLGNLVDNGNGAMVPIAVDVTPLLDSNQGFLYYTVDGAERTCDPLRSPAAVMASSIANFLESLEGSKSAWFSVQEQLTLSKLLEMGKMFDRVTLNHPIDQANSLQQLRRVWTVALSLAARGMERLHKVEHKGLLSQARTPTQESATRTRATQTDMQVLDSPQLSELECEDNPDYIAINAHDPALEDLYEFDWVRPMSRFDKHLPAELRHAKTLDADMTVLEYGIDVLLYHDDRATDAQRSYLRGLRQSIHHTRGGRSPRAVRRFERDRRKIWDSCWLIYFDLTEHMSEEIENVLGQLFHGRTSGCSYDEIAPLWKRRKQGGKEAPTIRIEQDAGEAGE